MVKIAEVPRRLNVAAYLSADDVECLWAVARRASTQDRWIAAYGRRLETLGLVTIESGWPRLTAAGVQTLERAAQDLWMKISISEPNAHRVFQPRPTLVKPARHA